jgi:putative IMPACT (imprinted ancient) family translation regulator
MLDVLLHSGIGEIAAVVTRYFGGVNLGKGGLVRAYGGCVQEALTSLATVRRVELTRVLIRVSYADVDLLRRVLDSVGAVVVSEEYGERVVYHADIPAYLTETLAADLREGSAGRIELDRP